MALSCTSRSLCLHPQLCERALLGRASPSTPTIAFAIAPSQPSRAASSASRHSRFVSCISGSCSTKNTRRWPQTRTRAVAELAEAPATDGLIMNLKVEGTITDSLMPKVTEALKKVEGVSNLKVSFAEGIAIVEVAKQTSIQATGEASSLLEVIKGQGFKLQNIFVSFDDPNADGDEFVYEYETSESS